MAATESPVDLTTEEVAAARAIGLAAVLRDLLETGERLRALETALWATTREPEQQGDDTQTRLVADAFEESVLRAREELEQRHRDAAERVDAMKAWTSMTEACPEVSELTGTDFARDMSTLDRGVARLGLSQEGDRPTWVMLEAWVATNHRNGLRWNAGKAEAMSPSVCAYQHALPDGMATIMLTELGKLHKKALKRLTKDAMPPGAQLTVGVAALGLAFVLPGSDVVGSFIGTHFMGLSGAAATSAGLAALGGGSLASGGFGMAGGAIVAGTMLKGTESAARHVMLARVVAQTSKTAFLSEIASLDVRCALGPEASEEVLDRLRRIEADLRAEWDANRPLPSARRNRIWGHLASLKQDPGSLADVMRQVKGELPPSEERNLATCVRALTYEIRYLESPEWKRRASSVPRFFGIPIAAGLIDVAEASLEGLLAEQDTRY